MPAPAKSEVSTPQLAQAFVFNRKVADLVLCPECKKCGLHSQSKTHFVKGVLNGEILDKVPEPHPDGYILVVGGKAPDSIADESGDLRLSKDYNFVKKILHNLGVLSRVWWQTSVRCAVYPKGKDVMPTKPQVNQCAKHLNHEISVIKPKAIIALGADASAAACGRRDVLSIAGQKIIRDDGIPVYPLWSFAYAMREPDRLLPAWGSLWEKVIQKIEYDDCEIPLDRVKPVEAWGAYIAEEWFTKMFQGMKASDTLRVEPMAWDMETRGNKAWSASFKIGLLSFYHEACEQPLIIPVDHMEAEALYKAFYSTHFDDDRLAPLWSIERRKLLDLVKIVLTSKKVKKTGHNVKFDENGIKAVEKYDVEGFEDDSIEMAYCLNPTRQGHYGLDDLCREMLSVPSYWKEVKDFQALKENTQSRWDFTIIPWKILCPYAAWDVFVLPLLRKELLRRLREQEKQGYGGWFVLMDNANPKKGTLSTHDYGKMCRKIHHIVTGIMERNGQAIDQECIDAVSAFYRQQAQMREEELLKHPDVISYGHVPNWDSPPQLRDFFINHLKLPIVHETEKGAASTDAFALSVWAEKHHSGVAKLLVSYREATKFLSTYITPLRDEDEQERLIQADGLVHGQLSTYGTRTGRLASKKPNLQNLPRRGLVKRLYFSRFKNGWIVQRDYSGLEVRVLALLSRDAALLDLYRKNGDVHMNTQKNFFAERANKKNKDQRSICKSSLFGNIYGQGDKGLFDLLTKASVMSPSKVDENGNPLPISIEECSEFNTKIRQAYPGMADYINRCHEAARRYKWCSTAFGFVRPLPEMESYEHWVRNLKGPSWGSPEEVLVRIGIGEAERQSVNSPIQGTAGDLTIYSAYMVWKAFKKHKLKALLVNCVHDSIYVDCPEEEVGIVNAIMSDIMDNSQLWLPSLLPGFDASWMDIPIIGECEIGLDAKDVVTAVEEYSLTDSSKKLKFKIPTNEEGEKLIKVDQDLLVWEEHKDLIRDYLLPIRKENEWHHVTKVELTR